MICCEAKGSASTVLIIKLGAGQQTRRRYVENPDEVHIGDDLETCSIKYLEAFGMFCTAVYTIRMRVRSLVGPNWNHLLARCMAITPLPRQICTVQPTQTVTARQSAVLARSWGYV
jgi:hypothetical protein